MDIRSHAGLTEDAITALDPALMEPPLTIPQGLRNPADIFFQKDVVRRTIIATYWAVILLAIPLWWHTTNIERLPLPEARVAQQVDRPFSIPVEICLRGKDAGYASRLEQTLKPVPGSRWDGLEIRVTGGACIAESREDAYTVSSGLERAIRGRRLIAPLGDNDANFYDLVEILKALILPEEVQEYQKQPRVVQFSSRYRLAFSLLNEDASSGNNVMSWNARKGVRDHIQPVIDSLGSLHNFTVESQVQFYAPLAFDVRQTEDKFSLTYEDLTVFVNSAEWTLSSSSSNDPVLHFVLFVPSAKHNPLHILNSDGTISKSTSFTIPQWGGISIYNIPSSPSSSSTPQLSPAALNRAFATFSHQLLKLLGIFPLPEGLSRAEDDEGVVSDWQRDALVRRRILETAKGSKDTLQGFMNLAKKIENMPIGKNVQKDVEGALSALDRLYETASTSLSESFAASSQAFNLASSAFYNPAMLALLYFPAEHKYAVYAPLFMSGMIPLVVAALREFKAWKKERRARAES